MPDSMAFNDKCEKIVKIANQELTRKGFVAPVDILIGLGILAPSSFENWRWGRTACLEEVLQSNLPKLSKYLHFFRTWAITNGLRPSKTAYVSRTRDREPLQFSRSGADHLEDQYSTHFISPLLGKEKLERLQKLSAEPDLVCFIVITDRKCSQCEADLPKGSFLYMEKDHPLCLTCAKLDHLEFLPSGDRKLTLRANKYSDESVVVVRFSKSRKRYERQGLLVTKKALERAEAECRSEQDRK